jgi:hypothetical protein
MKHAFALLYILPSPYSPLETPKYVGPQNALEIAAQTLVIEPSTMKGSKNHSEVTLIDLAECPENT